MKNLKITTICLILFSFFACKKAELAPQFERQYITQEQADLITAFATLTNGDESACNVVFDPSEIPDLLCRIVSEAKKGSEIVFLVDNTSSMSDDIDEVKRNINDIIDCLPEGIRLGAAVYGDYFSDGDSWFNYTPFTENYGEVRQYVNAIGLNAGGDWPESVYDGIYEVLDVMDWKDCKAPDKIIVMGDAPPKTGSGTVHSLEEVLEKAASICPDTEFYPVIVLDL